MDQPQISQNTFRNNIVYHPNAIETISFRNNTLTVEEFNAMNGHNGDVVRNNLEDDPLFVDIMNDNFDIHYSSPAIDAGLDVGLSEDFAGTLIPKGPAVDIGVFEYY